MRSAAEHPFKKVCISQAGVRSGQPIVEFDRLHKALARLEEITLIQLNLMSPAAHAHFVSVETLRKFAPSPLGLGKKQGRLDSGGL